VSRRTFIGRARRKLRYLRKRLRWARHNLAGRWRAQRELRAGRPRLDDLCRYEWRSRSQHGEDGILDAIFHTIGTTNRRFVEFGVGRGWRCNTAYLAHTLGWQGLMMDGSVDERSAPEVRQAFINAENIEELFEKHGVPREFDLLSIDIDGNDYWVWEAIRSYLPRVVVIEYRAFIPPDESATIPYDPDFVWDHRTNFCGASLLALTRLGERKGYRLVCCDSTGTNAFFVHAQAGAERFPQRSVDALYRPSKVGAARPGSEEARKRFIPV